jgi:PAS domain S-box-containing protein
MINSKPQILLVDDEPRFIDSLQGILTHFDYQCQKAYNGTEAISLLQTGKFDLALLDVDLPDMSGCEIAQRIRDDFSGITVIMLTGLNTVEVAVEAMKQGAYDFLSKPIDHDLLLRTLEKAHQHNCLEKDLQSSEQRFKILSEAAWEGIAIHSDGVIFEANQQFLQMFQYSEEDLATGIPLVKLLDPATPEETKTMILSGQEGSCTATGVSKNGCTIPIETKSRTINYLDEKRYVCTIRDISERVKAEEEKLALQKKLASASKLNALGLMAGSIAHDLNNILSGIVSYPDLLLLQMDESNKYYQQIQKIQESGKRAAAVVSDLVAITRGRQQPKEISNINEIILSYLNSIEHSERLAEFDSILVETRLRKDINNVCCSPQHIHKLLLNLIGNAMEASHSGSAITVSTEASLFSHPLQSISEGDTLTEHVKIVIADRGSGIPQESIEKIFDPFYSTKVEGKSGSGLGLSIVWNIVQDHNGWIEVKDNNPGAIFEIYLPATYEDSCPIPSPEAEPQHGSGESILIIDDQAEQNEILETSLSRLGYKTHSVTSGEEGIAYLRDNSVDLLLLDMLMGDGLNGRQTLEIIKQFTPNQRAIVISGYANREEIDRTRELGVSIFLEKPVTIARLCSSIQDSLRDSQPA